MGKKMKFNKKIPIFIGAILLVSLVGIIGYASLLNTDTAKKSNQMEIGSIEGVIKEDFVKDSPIKANDTTPVTKKITIKNEGNLNMFVRVMVFPEITKEDGSDTILLPANMGKEIMPVFSSNDGINTTDWIDGEDGYYYYKKAVGPGSTTPALFEGVKLVVADADKDEYKDASLKIQVKSETIISSDYQYRTAWWNLTVAPSSGIYQTIDNELKNHIG